MYDLGTSTTRLELGNLSLNIERGMNKIKGRGHTEPYQVTVPWTVLDPLPKDLLPSCHNTPVSQLPQCTSPIPHNATFSTKNVHMCAHFSYKMVHCGYLFNALWCLWNVSIQHRQTGSLCCQVSVECAGSNILRPGQNGRHFDNFVNENCSKILYKFETQGFDKVYSQRQNLR